MCIRDSFGLGNTGTTAGVRVAISSGSTTDIPLMVKGIASQSANLQEWQNSAGNILSRVRSDGWLYGTRINTLNLRVSGYEENSGGGLALTKQTAAASNPGAGIGNLYFRDGTNAGTLKLVVRAGAAGAETTILDNIPQ